MLPTCLDQLLPPWGPQCSFEGKLLRHHFASQRYGRGEPVSRALEDLGHAIEADSVSVEEEMNTMHDYFSVHQVQDS